MSKPAFYFLLAATVLLLAAFYVAGSDHPIRIWDEAIYANNALEMEQGGNVLVLKNNGSPSLYNTKPPFVIWCQAISMKVFGINEFAVRFPSMLAALGIFSALLLFLRRVGAPALLSALAILVLLASKGLMGGHALATGDLDAVLCFWTTAFQLSVLQMLMQKEVQPRMIRVSAAFFLGAFFTKSTAVFLTFPGLLAFLLISRRAGPILGSRHTWRAALACVPLIGAYYGAMAFFFPGYFEKVWFSEVERFYKNIMPWHEHLFPYYFNNLQERFYPFVYLLVPAIIALFPGNRTPLSTTGIYSIVLASCYFLFISIPRVKLPWYDAPAYPFLALMIATGIHQALQLARASQVVYRSIMIACCMLCLVLFSGVVKEAGNYIPELQEREGHFIREGFQKIKPASAVVIMQAEQPEHRDQVNFYRKKMQIENGMRIDLRDSLRNLRLHDTVIICQEEAKRALFSSFVADTILSTPPCLMLRIKSSAPSKSSIIHYQ